MQTGSLGDIVFTVSDEQIKTFRDFSLKGQANISSHTRHLRKDLPEFTGLKTDSVTLKVKLSKYLGTYPQGEMSKMKEYMNLGRLLTLTIGKEVVNYKWMISQLSFSAQNYDRYGTMTDVDVSLTLTEYPRS